MPLQRQKVDLIPKLNQAVDPRTAPPGTAVVVQNATRARAQEYKRRTGSTALGTSGVPSGTLPNVWQLGTHKNSLVALGKTGAAMPWVWNETAQRWGASDPSTTSTNPLRSQARGAVTSARQSVWSGEVYDAVGAIYPPFSMDVAVIPGSAIAIIVWENSGTSIGAGRVVTEVVWDLVTNTPIARTSFAGYAPHVEAAGTAATVVYYDGTNMAFRDWTASNVTSGTPHTSSTAIAAVTTAAKVKLDTCITTTTNKVAWAVDIGTGSIKVGIYDNSTHGFAISTVTADATESLGILRDFQATGNIYVVTAGSTDGVKLHICNGVGAETSSATLSTSATTAKANVVNICGFTIPNGTAGDFTCLWDVTAAAVSSTNPYDAQIMYASKVAGSLGAAAIWLRSVRLKSKPAVLSGSEVLVLTAYDSVLQPTYFLYSFDGAPSPSKRGPMAKITRWRAIAKTSVDNPTGITNLAAYGSQWLMAVGRAEETRVGGGTTRTTNGVDLVALTANPTTTGRPVEYADSMMVPAGQVMQYDGTRFCELNFGVYPEQPSYTLSAGGSLAVNADIGVPSTYEYVTVYRYTDAQGRVHRSTPSVPLSVTLPADGSQQTVNLTIPNLHIFGQNDLIDTNDGVIVELYRTTLTGTAFYLAYEFQNSPANVSGSLSDSSSDTTLDLLGSTQLYCSVDETQNPPGLLECHAPPQFVAMCAHRGRLWGIDADDPKTVWFSEPIAVGVGPVFNEALTFRVDDEWGDCTAIVSLDDKLVVLKRGAVYVVVGDGPDDTGIGSYPQAQRIAVGPGTASARSVMPTPEGVWFQSPKGLYLLDRGLNATEAGLVAEDIISGATVVDVVHVDAESQVRLYLSTGTCLVRDYTWQEWYHWTGQSTYAAVKYGTKVAQVSPGAGNVVWVSDSSVWADAGTGYTMKFTLAWLATAGITGFQRVYEILALGEYVATHNVRIAVSYDYVDTVVETREVVGAAPWQFRLKPQQQKCHGIKIAVYDVVSGGAVPTGDTFKFSGLALIAGVKSAGAKLPAAQRFGPTTS